MDEILNIIKEELKLVDKKLDSIANNDLPLISFALHHIRGGKKLRPALLLLSAKISQPYVTEDIINIACMIELLHTVSLIHDDVIDNSQLRRNKETLNSLFNNKTAILIGDYILSVAINIFSDFLKRNDDKLLPHLLSTTMLTMCEGAIMELETENITTEEYYFEMVKKKTAQLFATSCELGARLTTDEVAKINALKNFGLNFGIAFQITDDILNIESDKKEVGKPLLDDIYNKKFNLPLIKALLCVNEKERNKFGQPDEYLSLIKQYNGIEKARSEAQKYIEYAKESIKNLKETEEKQTLIKLCDFLINRKK